MVATPMCDERFRSPAQLASWEVPTRSDLRSLGLIVHEMFSGKRAFESLRAGVTPPRLKSHVSDVVPAVQRVILRCLSERPGSRPPSTLAIAVGDSGWLTRYPEVENYRPRG